jgi:hypothetical protein
MTDELILFQEEQKLLDGAHTAWLPSHEITNPRPVKVQVNRLEVNWWKKAGWIFIFLALAMGYFAAARTGAVIDAANKAEGFIGTYGTSLMVTGVTAIEGFLIIFGFFRPRKVNANGIMDTIEKSLGWLSLAIGLYISAIAGYKFFLQGSEYADPARLKFASEQLSLSLGVGITFMLAGISEFAGRLKFLHDNAEPIAEYEHDLAMAQWRAEMNAAWIASAIYLQIVGDRLKRAEQIQYDIDNATRGRTKVLAAHRQAEIDGITSQPEIVYQPVQVPAVAPTQQPEKKAPVKNLVRQWLVANGIDLQDLIDGSVEVSPAAIAADLHLNADSVRPALYRMKEDFQQRKNGQPA